MIFEYRHLSPWMNQNVILEIILPRGDHWGSERPPERGQDAVARFDVLCPKRLLIMSIIDFYRRQTRDSTVRLAELTRSITSLTSINVDKSR